MTCGAFDLACHVAAFFAPAWAFVLAWWWIAFGVGCMLLGAWIGPRGTLAILTIGIGLLVYDRTRGRSVDPDYETGEAEAVKPAPKKRKTLADLFRGVSH
jgi:hypothetical protein